MRRIDQHIIGQRSELRAERIVHHSGQRLFGHLAIEQIGATNIANKQRVAAKNSMGFAGLIAKQIARRFRRMTRRMQHLDGDIANTEDLAIFSLMDRIVWLRAGTEDDLRARSIGQVQMTGDKIRMEVRLQNILDRGATRGSHFHIGFGLANGINDNSFARALDIIRRFGEAVGIELFDIHSVFRTEVAARKIQHIKLQHSVAPQREVGLEARATRSEPYIAQLKLCCAAGSRFFFGRPSGFEPLLKQSVLSLPAHHQIVTGYPRSALPSNQ